MAPRVGEGHYALMELGKITGNDKSIEAPAARSLWRSARHTMEEK
jgi:hypothetical protein